MRTLGVVMAVGFVLSSRASAQDRARLETEAGGQAARADKLFKAGDYAAALPFYRAERVSRAALGDKRFEAYAIRSIGCCHERLGDDETAISFWHEARALDAKREDRGYEGYDLFLIGRASLRMGRIEKARDALTRSLPLLSRAIDRDHEADARLVLALSHLKDGLPEEAAPHFERAEQLADALDDPKRRALAWLGSGYVALSRDEPGLAAERFSDAHRGLIEADSRLDAAECLRALGKAYVELGHLDSASSVLNEAVKAHTALGNHAELAEDLRDLAALRADDDDLPAAILIARREAEARRASDDLTGEVDALVDLAHYQDLSGDRRAAAKTLAEALPIARRGVPAPRMVRLLLLTSDLSRTLGRPADADALLDEADRVARDADVAALRRLVADARAALKSPR